MRLVPAGQVHAYRNGSPDCRFLTITGPSHAREFFEQMDAEVTTLPPVSRPYHSLEEAGRACAEATRAIVAGLSAD